MKNTFAIRLLAGFGLLAIIWAIRFVTLGLYPLYDPSESRYAEMGRKMLETQNWVTPLIDYGVPFWGKPPLTIWLTASSLWFGNNEFFARLPSFMVSLASIWVIFRLVSLQTSRDKAKDTVIMLSSSVLFFVMAGTVAMDVCLNFAMTLTLAGFWLAVHRDEKYWGYVFFIGLAIGLLAKGPITIVLTGLTIGLWVLMTNAWRIVWQRVPWLSGTLLMLCISLPWYLLAEQRTSGFLQYFIVGEHWQRFTVPNWQGDLYGHGHKRTRGTIWLFWLVAAFPWSLIFLKTLLTALVRKNTATLLHTHQSWRLYCLLWMLAPLLFFTFSANIIWTYALPALAGLAMLLSDIQQQPRYQHTLALCVPLLFFASVIAYPILNLQMYASQKALVSAYQQIAPAQQPLIYVMDKPYSADFYSQGKAVLLKDISQLQTDLALPEHRFYVIRGKTLSEYLQTLSPHAKLIKSYGDYTLFDSNGK